MPSLCSPLCMRSSDITAHSAAGVLRIAHCLCNNGLIACCLCMTKHARLLKEQDTRNDGDSESCDEQNAFVADCE